VNVDYISLQDKRSTRKIEPFALIHTQDNWVLIAYCRLRNDFKAFRLDCIQQLTIHSDAFNPHKMTLQEYFKMAREKWESTPDMPLT
jgi:predicted DNA-binding transcriptional regulator YafY